PYWNPTNDATQSSAIAYVPETTWNDSCTNNVFVFLGLGTTPEASCNSPQLVQNAPATIEHVGGGGGRSNCTSPSGSTPSSCAGYYAKPAWQSALSPTDGSRDVPDVSLFAGAGFMGSGYILCEADQLPAPQTCSLNTAF